MTDVNLNCEIAIFETIPNACRDNDNNVNLEISTLYYLFKSSKMINLCADKLILNIINSVR